LDRTIKTQESAGDQRIRVDTLAVSRLHAASCTAMLKKELVQATILQEQL